MTTADEFPPDTTLATCGAAGGSDETWAEDAFNVGPVLGVVVSLNTTWGPQLDILLLSIVAEVAAAERGRVMQVLLPEITVRSWLLTGVGTFQVTAKEVACDLMTGGVVFTGGLAAALLAATGKIRLSAKAPVAASRAFL